MDNINKIKNIEAISKLRSQIVKKILFLRRLKKPIWSESIHPRINQECQVNFTQQPCVDKKNNNNNLHILPDESTTSDVGTKEMFEKVHKGEDSENCVDVEDEEDIDVEERKEFNEFLHHDETYDSILSGFEETQHSNIDRSNNTIKKVVGKLYFGKNTVVISNGKLLLNDTTMSEKLKFPHEYKLTQGLKNLIFLSDTYDYTTEDLNNYRKLCYVCNLFANRGKQALKYNNKFQLLSNFFAQMRANQYGNGSLLFKKYSSSDLKYQYYNSPNALVNRLKLLFGAKQAGHTNTEFEIKMIIHELRKRGVIF